METIATNNEILRSQNGPRGRILNALREHGPMTCEEIALHTRLSSKQVSDNARAAKADLLVDRDLDYSIGKGKPIYKITTAGRAWLKPGLAPEKNPVDNTQTMDGQTDIKAFPGEDGGCIEIQEHEPETTAPEPEQALEVSDGDMYAISVFGATDNLALKIIGRKEAIEKAAEVAKESGQCVTVSLMTYVGAVVMKPVFEEAK